MITPADQDYKDTKRVKIHGTPLLPMFEELAEWISVRYGVRVLNIILDTIEPDNRPRLNVVLEWRGTSGSSGRRSSLTSTRLSKERSGIDSPLSPVTHWMAGPTLDDSS
jgi:hypothetical protein